ncbi:aspartate/glutamate racemase family protein [Stigmatella sp. ncwal1]|uniref:Aspartate/glutamate racemase family protein n=1 Tax=Stigmatella ashevillensis TaxID=2995309 RepID=A0ABT5DDZ6_9BACT|nr:aspartate/glutamate racemase family protein [Stigmatella ashevillena]MDC0710552.1 aspartate/glutamate racemase family protein [Stigmatella ashevillena]
MKTMGLLGGMSWESSAEYYRIANEYVKARLGGHHSAKIVLYSVDFAEIEKCQSAGRWDEAATLLKAAAQSIERAGADILVLCTNTMHKLAGEISASIHIPFLHIAEATGQEIVKQGLKTVGLLGTRYTMEQDFYQGKLLEMGLNVVVPPEEDRQVVHRVIYDELCLGHVNGASREQYQRIIQGLIAQGAQGVILGCTEITLLIKQADVPVPAFDTTSIHAMKAAEFCLASGS